MQYQHKVFQLHFSTPEQAEKQLNALGDQGWRLVAVTDVEGFERYYMVRENP